MELIHIACYIQDEPLDSKNDLVILRAEAWREKKLQKSHDVRVALKTDLYLDCLSATSESKEEVHLYFETMDSWKDLKKVFKNPDFAFYLEDGFDLMIEQEEDMKIIESF